MLKKLPVIFLFLLGTISFSQQMFFEAGTSISTFHYKNSQGQSLDNLNNENKGFLGVGFRTALNADRWIYLVAGAYYQGYGAKGSDPILDNYYDWDINYLGPQVGLEFKIFRIREFGFFVKTLASAEFLIRGNQRIDNQTFELVGESEFENTLFFGRASAGINYPISSNTLVFANYTYGRSIPLETNTGTDLETLTISIHQFGIGLVINLPGCNCQY